MQRRSSFPAEGRAAPVTSNQRGAHPDLERVVLRHQHAHCRRPLATHTKIAFRAADANVRASGRPVILDCGCGTGESSHALATAFPDALVVGLDKSAARLARAVPAPHGRVVYVRAELGDLWRLAVSHRWPVAATYLLYPNPWPKRKHLMRRWHAHPAMTALVALGGRIELRTNWRTYAEEFVHALTLLGLSGASVCAWRPSAPVSAFERKYLESGHALYRVVSQPDGSAGERLARDRAGGGARRAAHGLRSASSTAC